MKSYIYSLLLVAAASVAVPQVAGAVTIDVPDIGNFQLIGSGTAAVNYGGATFSQSGTLSNGNLFNVSSGFSGQPAVLSSQQQSVGIPNILISLPQISSSISIKFGLFNTGSVNFLFSNGSSFTQLVNSTGFYSASNIFSSVESNPFNSVLVTSDAANVLNIQGITFQQAVTAAPEPATWLSMILGFGLIGAALRTSRKRKPALTFA